MSRFTKVFGIDLHQFELDFVDIPLDTDIGLFVDPFAISLEENDPWCVECVLLIQAYFEALIKAIKTNNKKKVLELLDNLHEPNDTHLGVSVGQSSGRGIGNKEAQLILDNLMNSHAVKTGVLADLGEMELLIPGIGPDKISDMTTNIIRGKLIEFTQEQCRKFNVPMHKVAGGKCYNIKREAFLDTFAELPVHEGNRILLVPRTIVRYSPSLNPEKFYNGPVLEYLQVHHRHPGDSLATLLKNKTIKVYKKDLKEDARYKYSKEFLSDMIDQQPHLLDIYKEKVIEKNTFLSSGEIEDHHPHPNKPDIKSYIADLKAINKGKKDANIYHKLIFRILQYLFDPHLRNGEIEKDVNDGTKRIDIVFDNVANKGFFALIESKYRLSCQHISIECKNYNSDVSNPEVDQLSGRLNKKRGQFGIMVCREVEQPKKLITRLKSFLNDDGKMMIYLTDADIIYLLKMKHTGSDILIDDHLLKKTKELVM